VVLLLGLGLDEFSMPSAQVLEVKNLIRNVTIEQARRIATQAMTLTTGRDVGLFLTSKLREILPDIYVDAGREV
jgi:phosphotransferase system enzyme I (PtsI)